MASSVPYNSPSACLYRVLGVDRSAPQDVLQSAYKRQALRWSPDGNPPPAGSDAEIRLKRVEYAYEILSNPRDRAWYDANREQIVEGITARSSRVEDPCQINLYPYFSATCFADFSNGPDGFYQVFNAVFESIGNAERVSVPYFGDADSPWSRARKFYSFWENFSTRRRFEWAATYNLSDAANRRARGTMKNANTKAIEARTHEWQTNVRRLCRFVKSLDPRVRIHSMQDTAERRQNEQSAKRRAQDLKQIMDSQREAELKEDVLRLQASDEDLGERAKPAFACGDCGRVYRTQGSYQTHMKSSTHLQKVKLLPAESATVDIAGENVPPPVETAVETPVEVPSDDDALSDAPSVGSNFSDDFVLVDDVAADFDAEFRPEIVTWDATIDIQSYSDHELELIDVDVLDGAPPPRQESATEDALETVQVVGVNMDLMLAQQLATGLIAGNGNDHEDGNILAQLDDPAYQTNLDHLLALQLEQEDLMARQRAGGNLLGDNLSYGRHANAIDSDDDEYDSELDTLVDAISANMISLDDPSVNVRDLEKRLQRAITRSGKTETRRKNRRKRRNKNNSRRNADNSSDEAEETAPFSEMNNERKEKKEAVSPKKRRRRRRAKRSDDPTAVPRCGVCHRGFASKVKLVRHLDANPEHVQS